METETPLDVLSRAASLLDNEVILHRGLRGSIKQDVSDSSSLVKDLPRRGIKHRRKERRDHEYMSGKSRTRKTAGTQTSASLMSGSNAVDREEEDDISNSSSTELQESDIASIEDNSDSPLDMTTTNRKMLSHSSNNSVYEDDINKKTITPTKFTGEQQRPSVITCASNLFHQKKVTTSTIVSSSNNARSKADEVKKGHRREVLSGMCDPVIDEHFRRSLGKDYPEMFSGATVTNTVTESGLSVDDHFAKALGDTWLRLQGKVDSPSDVNSDSRMSSSTIQKQHTTLNSQKSLA